YPKELSKWSNYRTGSKIATQIFFILALSLTVGLFIHTSMNSEFYKDQYVNTTEEVVTGVLNTETIGIESLTDEQIMSQLPQDTREQLESMSPEQRQRILENIRSRMEGRSGNITANVNQILANRVLETDRFDGMIEFALFSSILAIGGIFMLFEKVLYGPLMGLVTFLRGLAVRIRREE
ncbi:MAG: hypothetical protein ABEJ72_00445, partial [Candidatus Aenigmatarchaeota archaeon]